MKKIRWGILGTGKVTHSFAEGLRSTPGAELVAVGSRTVETASAFAAKFGIPRSFGTYQDLASADDVDAIYIASVNPRHKEDCLMCIDAGKAVLCEKPFAMNARDAQEIVDRARAKHVFFMEAMWMRFIPLVQKARDLVRSGAIGVPCLLQADFGYPVENDPGNRFFDPALGGGSLLDRGIYPLSLAWFLLGPPSQVSGQASIGRTRVDEQSTILLNYADGPQAMLSSTLKTYGTNRALITGTTGSIELADPFFKTERLVLTQFPGHSAATASPKTQAGTPPVGPSKLRQLLRRAKRVALRIAGHRPGQTIFAEPLVSNGYNYEASEVGRCLLEGLLESPVMTQSESIEIIRAMDSLRRDWGISYPNDPRS